MEIQKGGGKWLFRPQREPALGDFSLSQIGFLTFQQSAKSADSIFTSL